MRRLHRTANTPAQTQFISSAGGPTIMFVKPYPCQGSLLLLAATTLALPATAQERPAAERDDIIVTARAASASILGSDVSPLAYPQSVRVLDRTLLDATNATRLADVFDLAGGIARQNDFGGLWDKVSIRGFAGDENAGPDIRINRFSSNFGFNAPIDTATIEQVEILKGATAALSGLGEPGGAINIVTKAPLDTFQGSAAISYGSWNSARASADVTGPLSDGLSVRLIGVAEARDSFREQVRGSRQLIAPSIAWRPADALRLLYQAEYMRNTSVLDRGVVAIGGNARAMDRRTFLGEPGDGDIVQTGLWQQASLFADLGGDTRLELGGSHRDGSLRGYATMVDFGPRGLQADGRTAGRDRRYHDFDWQDLSLRAELTAKATLFGMTHDLRIGADRVRHAMDFVLDRARGTAIRPLLPIDLFDPVYAQTTLPVPPAFASRYTRFRSESVYAQDLIGAGPFTLLLGARWNSFRETVINRLAANRRLETEDKGVTPRVALTWRASEALALYASWGESLRLNPSEGVNTFDAERSHSAEAGVKFALFGGRLTGQAALFDMIKRNVLNPNAVDPFVKTQIGRQRSRGGEIELNWTMAHDLLVTGTYTHLDATVRNDANVALIGTPLSNVPADMGSLFVQKTLGRVALGGGVSHVGRRAGDPFGTAYRLPAYTIARANLSFAVSERLTLRADIENLFDTNYIASSYANVWTMPGAPRNFRVTASTRF
ncbi:TonB-dependent receptor [Sphingomonas sp. HT-1]|uniref:TonB-dependent receptor n=1 Tax=unclassified Sphingomonas TaxID=196159 RepID=UPI00037F1CA8|nr:MULTISPECIES: TonB-dependent siderophore receptor [unclassified Sphingomonas]KTF70763.1 TonB-dependent receptor [Sphingomonas sp. WG]